MYQTKFAVLLIAMLSACSAELSPIDNSCIDLSSAADRATFTGRLTLQIFPGPPNYTAIANGDAEERAYILELGEAYCASGDDFIDDGALFDRVHLTSDDEALLGQLATSIGNEVKVSGAAFGSHTGHHHAPVVLFADQMEAR